MSPATLLTHLRVSPSQGRLLVLAVITIGLVVFDRLPSVLELDPTRVELWFVVGWIVAPFVAGLAALRAAAKSEGSGRRAWRCFALGCLGWISGIIIWASSGWLGAVNPFPSLADVMFICTGILFMIGMYHYSLAGSGESRTKLTNFALAITSVITIGFILYFPLLVNSTLGLFGTIAVFIYPALWLSTFTFGFICYCLYVPRRRRLPFFIILCAMGFQTVANFFYGFDILNQSYSAGTFYDTYWIGAYVLVGWAALEHSPAHGHPLRPAGRARSAVGEALIPAISTTVILTAVLASNWHHLGPSGLLLVPIAIGFAACLGLREYTVFAAERKSRHEAEETAMRLAESEAQLSSVLENTIEGVMVLDTQWRITYANKNAIDMLFSDRPFLGLPLWDVLSPRADNEFYKHYCIAMEHQTPVEFEAYFAPLDVWFEDRAFPTPDNLTIFFRDVTERRRLRDDAEKTARRLAESEARLSTVLENTTDGVMVLDTQWRITFANQNAIDMLFSDRQHLGTSILDIPTGSKDSEFFRFYCTAMERQVAMELEAYFAPLDIWIELHAYPASDNLTIFFRDVTERRRLREELVCLAHRDPLTGVANRTVFAERLAAGLHSGRRDSDLILVAMDLDGFKMVNDTMGHAAGDALLKEFASRLTGLVRKGDTVARLGGDEFAIIQPGPIEADGGAGIARRINAALHTPFDIEGCKVAVAASIGIVLAPEHGTDPDDLIRKADLALYHAKQNNCDANYCIYQPDIEDRTPSRQLLRLDKRRSSSYAS